jgi:riboflavin synthase alpha subunit
MRAFAPRWATWWCADSLAASLPQCAQTHTNLPRKHPGDWVDVEADIIARYHVEALS